MVEIVQSLGGAGGYRENGQAAAPPRQQISVMLGSEDEYLDVGWQRGSQQIERVCGVTGKDDRIVGPPPTNERTAFRASS